MKGTGALTRVAGTALALTAGVAGLAGCGDGEPGEPAEERRTVDGTIATPEPSAVPSDLPSDLPTFPPDGPAAAYVAWVDALSRRDAAAACSLQAPELTIQLRYDAILVDRAELGDPCVGFEALLWEDPEFDPAIEDVEVTQETREDALLDVEHADRDLTVRVVYHRAKWRVFSVSDRSAPEDGGTDSGPARWLRAWCALSPDQSRDEIIALMGEPSGEYTVSDGGEPQLWWAQDQYDFRVYLDVDGSVLELVGDYDALDADDRSRLSCPELRS